MYYYHPEAYFSNEQGGFRIDNWSGDPDKIQRLFDNRTELINRILEICYSKTEKKLKKEQINLVIPNKIEYKLAPRTFYCKKCKQLERIEKDENLKTRAKKGFKCSNCNGSLKQTGLVFVCNCGRIEEIEAKEHCKKPMKLIRPFVEDVSTWYYECSDSKCKKSQPLEMYCKNSSCGARMRPKPIDASGLITPLSATIVNYSNPELEWIAEYLNIENKEKREHFLKAGLDDDTISMILKRDIIKDIDKTIDGILNDKEFEELVKDEILKNNLRELIKNHILDYKSILRYEKGSGKNLNKFGIEKVTYVDGIKLINCVYGFTVGSSDLELIKEKDGFRFFHPPGNLDEYQILINSVETEGIIFKLNQEQLAKWLRNNEAVGIIDNKNLKEWFLKIAFLHGTIEDNKVLIFLHTLSHSLIKTAPFFCGVDSNTIREILLPGIPAFLLYNTTNSTLGSMKTMFDTKIDRWIDYAYNEIQSCIHDPVCNEDPHGAACAGCILLSEISCSEFNANLDRRIPMEFWRQL